jgi:PKD repeat protein
VSTFASTCRRLRARAHDDSGFSVVEMVVAMTLLATAMLALAQIMFGSMAALSATNQRSVFLELATAEMEDLRATPYEQTCVRASDPNGYADFEGAVPVVGTNCPAARATKATPAMGSYNVRRYITWTDATGGTPTVANATFKRLVVLLDWVENNKTTREIRLESVRYPGGFGETAAPPGANQAPVAVPRSNAPLVASTTTAITFNGTSSTDDAGLGNLTFSWDFGDGTTGTGQTVTKTFTVADVYQVVLTVTDSGGLSHSAPLEIRVARTVAGNLDPVVPSLLASCNARSVASVTCVPTDAYAPLGISFDATASYDPDADDELYFVWNWGDGTPLEGGWAAVASHTFAAARTYTVTVTAYDLRGGAVSQSVVVESLPLNCEVTTGTFKNGTGENDYIRVKGNDTAHTTSFTFSATSNTACSNLRVRMPVVGGHLVFDNLTRTVTGDTVTWSATRTFANNTQFHLLANQTAEYIPTSGDATKPAVTFPGKFTVAKDNL